MTLRPPTSTLFPYTTLFRSRALDHRPRDVSEGEQRGRLFLPDRGWKAELSALSVADNLANSALLGIRDRKSIRLNSSHTVISYAVFCLKKKKTTQPNS